MAAKPSKGAYGERKMAVLTSGRKPRRRMLAWGRRRARIGNGRMEGVCKTVVAYRFKHRGALAHPERQRRRRVVKPARQRPVEHEREIQRAVSS